MSFDEDYKGKWIEMRRLVDDLISCSDRGSSQGGDRLGLLARPFVDGLSNALDLLWGMEVRAMDSRCATCVHYVPETESMISRCVALQMHVTSDFGCVKHSAITSPAKHRNHNQREP